MHLKGKIFGITRIYKITIEIHRRARYRHTVSISNLGGSQKMKKLRCKTFGISRHFFYSRLQLLVILDLFLTLEMAQYTEK